MLRHNVSPHDQVFGAIRVHSAPNASSNDLTDCCAAPSWGLSGRISTEAMYQGAHGRYRAA